MYSHPHSCPLALVDGAYVTMVKDATVGCIVWVERVLRRPYLAPHPPSAISSPLNSEPARLSSRLTAFWPIVGERTRACAHMSDCCNHVVDNGGLGQSRKPHSQDICGRKRSLRVSGLRSLALGPRFWGRATVIDFHGRACCTNQGRGMSKSHAALSSRLSRTAKAGHPPDGISWR